MKATRAEHQELWEIIHAIWRSAPDWDEAVADRVTKAVDALVVAERERCAKIADQYVDEAQAHLDGKAIYSPGNTPGLMADAYSLTTAQRIADAIRNSNGK